MFLVVKPCCFWWQVGYSGFLTLVQAKKVKVASLDEKTQRVYFTLQNEQQQASAGPVSPPGGTLDPSML